LQITDHAHPIVGPVALVKVLNPLAWEFLTGITKAGFRQFFTVPDAAG